MELENSLTQLQKRRNADSSDTWELAEPHRNRVLQLVLQRKSEVGNNLCVLGAGNCNDLDLARLCQDFQRMDLVDVDLDALEKGVQSQGCDMNEICLHGDCDVTGVWPELAQLADASDKAPDRIDQLLAKSEAWTGLPELGSFSTVVSVCLLSQLVDGVIKALGESHSRCLEVIAAMRQRHLRLLYELAAPGGQVILVTDFVSSDTAPTLPQLSGKALSNALMQMIKQHNFFTGLNPLKLQMVLREDPVLAPHIHAIDCEQPWLWDFGPRHYAVTAISFRRR